MTTLKQAMTIERLLGGAAIFIGVSDDAGEAKNPLDLKSISAGALRFLNVIPRNRITKAHFETNPLSEGFGRPSMYTVSGYQVHRSRLLIFDGQPLTPQGLSGLGVGMPHEMADGFGHSKLRPIINDLERAAGTRQGAFHLLNIASLLLFSTDVAGLSETESGNARLQEIKSVLEQISIYRMALLDNAGGEGGGKLQTVTTSFSASARAYCQISACAGSGIGHRAGSVSR